MFACGVVFCHLGFANSFVDLGDDPGHGDCPEEPVVSGALQEKGGRWRKRRREMKGNKKIIGDGRMQDEVMVEAFRIEGRWDVP